MRHAAYLSTSRHGIFYFRLPIPSELHPVAAIRANDSTADLCWRSFCSRSLSSHLQRDFCLDADRISNAVIQHGHQTQLQTALFLHGDGTRMEKDEMGHRCNWIDVWIC
ncbi:hypothetical protein SAMN05444414_102183 [Roseovarius marisflavi]|uniref:Uncharacterized protein n=1 Tax=Roseovarius marisflavi TaxID=1054996 RepID=A0A1M6W8C8_9RHOB|nr:hypothetical protein SAMN05444414_102183 [Roseovarius marisflavi]